MNVHYLVGSDYIVAIVSCLPTFVGRFRRQPRCVPGVMVVSMETGKCQLLQSDLVQKARVEGKIL